jgi:hypothetical protein
VKKAARSRTGNWEREREGGSEGILGYSYFIYYILIIYEGIF